MTDQLGYLSAGRLATQIRERALSPVEVMQAVLSRIEQLDPALTAFISHDAEGSMSLAREAERQVSSGEVVGPLHGVPVAIKDVIPVRDMRFTCGSQQHSADIAAEDALLVSRMRAAGAIVVGKTNTPEFAAYMNTTNSLVGTTLNPWNLELSSGGSSGGSAVAVATGMCAVGVGTDHGGSIRLPAAFNGVIGVRPTPGLVPGFPNVWVYDEFDVHGPLVRTVDDADLVLSVISGGDDRVPLSGRVHERNAYREPSGIQGWRVAWSVDLGGLFPVEREVKRITEDAVARFVELGASVESDSPQLQDAAACIRPLRAMRALIEHGDRLGAVEKIENVLLREFLKSSADLSTQSIADAHRARSAAWVTNAGFFDRFDLLVLPTTQVSRFGREELGPSSVDGIELEDPLASVLATYAITMMGWTALSLPCGFTADGVPIGLQLVGPPGGEALILRAAAAYEEAFGGFQAPPVLPVS